MKGIWSIPWGSVDGRNPDGSLETPDHAAVRVELDSQPQLAAAQRQRGQVE